MATAYLALAAVAAACSTTPSRRDPASPATLAAVDRAQTHERARRYDRARTEYESAVRGAPDARSRAWAARQFASALIFWGEYGTAERELARVVNATPTDAAAWHDLGMLRHRRGDATGAETALRSSIEHAPQDPRPRIALAALLVVGKRYREALAEYERILELDGLSDRMRTAVDKGMRLLRAELQ